MDSSSVEKKKAKAETKVSSSEGRNSLASLPPDVLFIILDKLLEPEDHISFAGVCKDWCSLSRNYNIATQRWHKKGSLLPLFLISSTESKSEEKTSSHALESYKVSTGKRCKDKIYFPVTHGRRCCGSSHGWLAILDVKDICLSITLVHPFQKSLEAIKLPLLDFMKIDSHRKYCSINHFKNNYKDYIRKVIFSSDPILNPYSYVVVVLYAYGNYSCTKLAFIKGGQRKWTYADRRQNSLKDAIFYRNQVFVLGGRNGDEKIMSLDVNSCNKPSKPPKVKEQTPKNVYKHWPANSYLVESVQGDHLWHVRRFVSYSRRNHPQYIIERFEVYKVVFDDKDGSVVEQVEVHNIGDEALFVGVSSHSISVLASSFPGCKPNSIYHTTGTEEPYQFEYLDPKTYHIYCLDDATIREYELNRWRLRRLHSEIPHGVWILPMFKGLF